MSLFARRIAIIILGGACTFFASAPAHPEEVWPMPEWPTAEPEEMEMDKVQLTAARDFALTGGGSGCIVRGGRLVMAWGPQRRRYDLKSTTKSVGVTALGLALADGKIKGLLDKAGDYHPSLGVPPDANAKTGWLDKITLFHLATQTAGFAKPGGYTKLLFEPGAKWSYSDGGPNWLAECLTLIYKTDLRELMFRRVFTPLGIASEDLSWRSNWYRPKQIEGLSRRELGSGIHANVDAMARIGLLYLRRGRWQRKQILPADFVAAVAGTPDAIRRLPVVGKIGGKPKASAHYGLLWWNNNDGAMAGVPRDAFWSWGLHDSHIVVIPSLDIVVARAGQSWKRGRLTDYEVLARFLEPIAASVKSRRATTAPAAATGPCPPSKVITGITWAPPSSIVRKAAGSDNWPMTWGDDDAQYAAYGDGWGFDPKVPEKLSLGLAKVTGPAESFRGVNIRSATGEDKGDGPRGRKASGMLMVKGVLYMWARNADRRGNQSQLAWSGDRGKTWTWAKWKFRQLGYPCFLNFGRDYAGARDEHVYVYSPDTPSAYQAGDRVVLARVPVGKIADRSAYEFFVRPGRAGDAVWSGNMAERGAVLSLKNGCNRMAVTYNAPLKRYLMTMRSRRGGRGGGASRNHFAIYDAPEPWGPWTTVFQTETWDVDPGEAQHIPAKWISADGRAFHLVFSGGDAFCVRRARLEVLNP